jgi:hypothetical protein
VRIRPDFCGRVRTNAVTRNVLSMSSLKDGLERLKYDEVVKAWEQGLALEAT